MSKKENIIEVLTLNLHTYQEEDQKKKFSVIVKAIQDLTPDIVAFQECAQHREASVELKNHHGNLIKKDNMALLITDLLREAGLDYDYYWDWSHYAWNEWEEGSAILTNHKIKEVEERYITQNKKPTSWKARKIIRAKVKIPGCPPVNAFSIHTGGWSDKEEPFKFQFQNLIDWQKEVNDFETISLLLGDFNIDAGSPGYKYMINNGRLKDLYYEANPNGFDNATIGGKIDGWEDKGTVDRRIDYIFAPISDPVAAQKAEIIFKNKDYKQVSDHRGIYACLKVN